MRLVYKVATRVNNKLRKRITARAAVVQGNMKALTQPSLGKRILSLENETIKKTKKYHFHNCCYRFQLTCFAVTNFYHSDLWKALHGLKYISEKISEYIVFLAITGIADIKFKEALLQNSKRL